MKKIILAGMLTFATIGSSLAEVDYNSQSIGQVSEVMYGTIAAVNIVHINGKAREGAGIGGMAGAWGGAMAAAGSGHILTSVAGSITGALAGAAIGGGAEDVITEGKAYQFTVQTDNGRTFAVMQKNLGTLHIGSKVKVLYSGNNTRIFPVNSEEQ